MKFKDLINHLDEQFPKSLSLTGDNDGVDVCVDYNLEIGRVLLVLDVTFEAINHAVTNGYNCILSHHPMIYRPLQKLDLSCSAAKKAVMLASHNICAASYHTRLDAVDGGVNDCLLKAADIVGNVEMLFEEDIPIGRVVTLSEEINVRDFSDDIRKALRKFYKTAFSFDADFDVNYLKGSGKVKKIGVVSGSAASCLEIAAKMGADTFFAGEINYHNILEANEFYDINIITAGHFETEAVVLPFVKQTITKKFPDANVDCFIGANDNP